MRSITRLSNSFPDLISPILLLSKVDREGGPRDQTQHPFGGFKCILRAMRVPGKKNQSLVQLEDKADTHCLHACVSLQDLHLTEAEAHTESAVDLALRRWAHTCRRTNHPCCVSRFYTKMQSPMLMDTITDAVSLVNIASLPDVSTQQKSSFWSPLMSHYMTHATSYYTPLLTQAQLPSMYKLPLWYAHHGIRLD